MRENDELLLATAEAAAKEGGKLIRERWQQPRHVSDKGFRDWVTDADLAAQKAITDLILERFPQHAFLAEEEDATLATGGDVVWIVDPLDGTSNFSRQLPNFAISIAAAVDGVVKAGVVFDPLRREMFSAAAGRGSTLNGAPLHTSQTAELARAIIALDWSHSRARRQATLEALGRFLHHVHTVRALGTAALALAWVAAGRLDAYLNVYLHPWDVAAGALLVREAGGPVSDWQANPWALVGSPKACLGCNPRLQQQLLALIGGA